MRTADPRAGGNVARELVALLLAQAAALALGEIGTAAGVADVGEEGAAGPGLVLRATALEMRDRLFAALDGATILVGRVGREERLAARQQQDEQDQEASSSSSLRSCD
jgi:hypothetical protein